MTLDLAGVSVRRPPLSEEVYELLKKLVITGQLVPGKRYAEHELAGALGVSRTPIREALRRLHQDGFVSIQSGKGVRVAALSRADLEKIYPIISVLEGLCARLTVEHMTEEVLLEMRHYHQEMKRSLAAKDTHAFLAVNMKFHDVYIRCSQNPELCRMIRNLRGRIQRFRLISLSNPGRLKASQRQHQQIIGAFSQRKARVVERLVRLHVLDGMTSALIRLEQEPASQETEGKGLAESPPFPWADSTDRERSMVHVRGQ